MPIIPIAGNLSVAAQRGTLNGNFSYLAGLIGAPIEITAPVSVGASPFTYTAGATIERVYLSGGAITSITRNGVSLGGFVPFVLLFPGEAMVLTYVIESPPASPPDGIPTMVVDR